MHVNPFVLEYHLQCYGFIMATIIIIFCLHNGVYPLFCNNNDMKYLMFIIISSSSYSYSLLCDIAGIAPIFCLRWLVCPTARKLLTSNYVLPLV